MLKRITTPAPIFTAPALRDWLRVDDSAEDNLIAALVDVSTNRLDGPLGELGIQLASAVYELETGHFSDRIPLEISPVSEILSIAYVDPAGVTRTEPTANWTIEDHPAERWAFLVRRDRAVPLPDTSRTITHPVKITFRAGFGAPLDVPPVIKHCIRMQVATMFDMRESSRYGTGGFVESPEAKAMLSAYRRGWNC